MFRDKYLDMYQRLVNKLRLTNQLQNIQPIDVQTINISISKQNETIFEYLNSSDQLNIIICLILLYPYQKIDMILEPLIKKYRQYECEQSCKNESIYEMFFSFSGFGFAMGCEVCKNSDSEVCKNNDSETCKSNGCQNSSVNTNEDIYNHLGFTFYVFINYIYQHDEKSKTNTTSITNNSTNNSITNTFSTTNVFTFKNPTLQSGSVEMQQIELMYKNSIYYKEMLGDGFCIIDMYNNQYNKYQNTQHQHNTQYQYNTQQKLQVYEIVQNSLETFFSKTLKYAFLINQIIQLCQYKFYKIYGFQPFIQPNMFNQFKLFIVLIKYVLYIKSQTIYYKEEQIIRILKDEDLNLVQQFYLGDKQKDMIYTSLLTTPTTIQTPSSTLQTSSTTQPSPSTYSSTLYISSPLINDKDKILKTNVYDSLLNNPSIIFSWIPTIYQMCFKNMIYINTYIKPLEELNKLLQESEDVYVKEYCIKCNYDLMMDDIVQYECGHQICQSCFINYFKQHYHSILQQRINNPLKLKCLWCQKDSNKVIIPFDTKNYLIKHLPTIQRMKYIYEHSISKHILQLCDSISFVILQEKYNLNSSQTQYYKSQYYKIQDNYKTINIYDSDIYNSNNVQRNYNILKVKSLNNIVLNEDTPIESTINKHSNFEFKTKKQLTNIDSKNDNFNSKNDNSNSKNTNVNK